MAPEIEQFDEGEFGTKRAAAESTFKRRKAEALELGLVEQIGVVFSRKHA
jgi:hypothetical protein